MLMRPKLGRIFNMLSLLALNSVKYGAFAASHSNPVEMIFVK